VDIFTSVAIISFSRRSLIHAVLSFFNSVVSKHNAMSSINEIMVLLRSKSALPVVYPTLLNVPIVVRNANRPHGLKRTR
jgi:hypothetical protein